MFRNEGNGQAKAETIATWLAEHNEFMSHGRHIDRDALLDKGLIIEELEGDPAVQDSVLSAFHATSHTFTSTAVVKVIENHLGKAFVQVAASRFQQVMMPAMPPGVTPSP